MRFRPEALSPDNIFLGLSLDKPPSREQELDQAFLNHRDFLRAGARKELPNGEFTVGERSLQKARRIFAWLRTQNDLPDQRALELKDMAGLYPKGYAPFHTESLRRDPRVADLDKRYGITDLFESKTDQEAVTDMVQIAFGRAVEKPSFLDQPTPIQDIGSLLQEKIGDEQTAKILHAVTSERVTNLQPDTQQFDLQLANLHETVVALSEVPLAAASHTLSNVVEYGFTNKIDELVTLGLIGLYHSLPKTREEIRSDPKVMDTYFSALNNWQEKVDLFSNNDHTINSLRAIIRTAANPL